MADKEAISGAVNALDPGNDDHWTNSGLPAVEALKDLLGEDVTRAQIIEAVGDYTREKAAAGTTQPPAPPENELLTPAASSDPVPADDDPFDLLNRLVAICGTDRYRRNSSLQSISLAYQNVQDEAKQVQERLDSRFLEREQRKLAESA